MKTNILFVCLGNICRSPTAQGVFETAVARAGMSDLIHIDSAATAAFHVGNPPDPRSIRAAAARGYDLSHQRARQVRIDDFYQFDYVLPMDRMNFGNLKALRPNDASSHLALFMEYSRLKQYGQVPDPYSGGEDGFELVLDLLEDAAQGLIHHLQTTRVTG